MDSIFENNFLNACLGSKQEAHDKKKYVLERVSTLFQTMPQEEALKVTQSDVRKLRKMYATASVKEQKCCVLILLQLLAMSLPPIENQSCSVFADITSLWVDVARSDSDVGVLLTVLESTLHVVSKFKAACLQGDSNLNHVLFVLLSCVGSADQRIAQVSLELSETLKEIVRGSCDLVSSRILAEASYAVLLDCSLTNSANSVARQLWCFQWIHFLYDLPGHVFMPHLIPTAEVLAQLASTKASSSIGRPLLDLLDETRSEFVKVIAQNPDFGFSEFYEFCPHVLADKQVLSSFKTTVVDWLREVLFFSSFSCFVAYFDTILSCILHLLDSDAESDLYKVTVLVHERALELFRENDCQVEAMLYERTLRSITPFIEAATGVMERSCVASIEWIQFASERFRSSTSDQQQTIHLLVPLVACEKGSVAARALNFLWTLCHERGLEKYFASQLAAFFQEQPLTIPLHLPLVLGHLQGLDNNKEEAGGKQPSPCSLLELFVCSVSCTDDARFIAKIAFTLSIAILTSPTFLHVRHAVPMKGTLFANLFSCFKYQCVASLALCLLAQKYGLGKQVAGFMSRHELSVNTLMQLDRLAELLNSPVFVVLRCRLVTTNADADLLECLYTILMMLPVGSPQHNALSNRLRSAADFITSCSILAAASRPLPSFPLETCPVGEKDKQLLEELQLAQNKLSEGTC